MLLQLQRLPFLLSSLIIYCQLIGCATQMPASEGLVFADYKTESEDNTFTEHLWAQAGSGISYILPFNSLVRAASNKYGDGSNKEFDNLFLTSFPFNPSFGVFYRDRIALGSSLPLTFLGLWQIDATVRLFSDFYLTVSRQILRKNTQIILQRRILSSNGGGISLGLFYRYDPLDFNEPEFGDLFYISWFGIRSLLQTPSTSKIGFHLRGFLDAGYVPEFNTPMISVGVSVVLRAER